MRTVGAKEKVERAAIALFAEKGIDGVSIGQIAAAAGVSQGALYRHYPSKEELARRLFSTAYLRTGEELDGIRAREAEFRALIGAMIAHFCALYDGDPALFRFMLLTQHDFLPRLLPDQRTPVDAVVDSVADAVRSGAAPGVEAPAAAAAIMGIVLQTALFHLYGRLTGPLLARAPSLARAAVAAVENLGRHDPVADP